MDLKRYFKLGMVLPIIIGLMAGSILFLLGEIDDAPGLCLIGIVLCVGLMFIGIKNINKINENIKPIIVLPIFFGMIGILSTLILFINGEFRDSPGFFILLNALYIGCIFTGIFNIKRIRQKIDPGIIVPVFYCVCGILLALALEFDGEISIIQRIVIIVILLFIGFLSMGIIMLVRKYDGYIK